MPCQLFVTESVAELKCIRQEGIYVTMQRCYVYAYWKRSRLKSINKCCCNRINLRFFVYLHQSCDQVHSNFTNFISFMAICQFSLLKRKIIYSNRYKIQERNIIKINTKLQCTRLVVALLLYDCPSCVRFSPVLQLFSLNSLRTYYTYKDNDTFIDVNYLSRIPTLDSCKRKELLE